MHTDVPWDYRCARAFLITFYRYATGIVSADFGLKLDDGANVPNTCKDVRPKDRLESTVVA